MLALDALGTLELRADGRMLLAGRRKPLALLVYLLRAPEREAAREELATLLWERSGDALARGSLRQTLSELRGAAGDALVADGARVRVSADRFSFDVAEFEADVDAARYAEATVRWRGEFLAGLDDVGGGAWRAWIERERVALRRRLAFAFERVIDHHQSRGEWRLAADAAERWRRLIPGDERAWMSLVQALRTAGRLADAAARHAEGLLVLRDELGREPTPAFAKLGASVTRAARSADTTSPDTARQVPGARALMSPDMIGREEVFGAIVRLWSRVRTGDAGVVVIEGEEGIGKTRLCEELTRFARGETGAMVVEGRAFSAELDRAFATLRPIVARLADAPGLAAAPPHVLAGLARIVPALRERFRSLPASGTASDLADDVARALAEVAAETPLLLAIDDAPDADPASLAVIAALVRRPPIGTMFVLTGRSDAWRRSRVLDGAPHAGLGRFVLAPLAPDGVRAMLTSMVPLAADIVSPIAQRLHEVTGGHPGQIVLLMAHLADRGIIAPDPSGVWRLSVPADDLPLEVPDAIREGALARLDGLGPEARRLASAAAVLGPRVGAPVLESVVQLPPESFQRALGDVLASRLLRASPGAVDHYEFNSEVSRQAVYAILAPSERRRLHRRAAAALLTAIDPAAPDRRAYHLRLAGGDRQRRRRGLAIAGVGALAAATFATGALVRRHAAAVPPNSQVLLADVQNLTGDPIFDQALGSAATVALEQSRHVQVFPRVRVAAALARMQRVRANSVLTEPLARELAEREGIPVVVALSIVRLDSTYALTARLVDPRTGDDRYADHQRAVRRADVLDALDRLLVRTRRALGESGTSMVANAAPLPRVTTGSLEALRAYADGERAWAAAQWNGARDEWARAVSLDSSFAMALSALATYEYAIENDRVTGGRYLARALAHLDRLTPREQLTLRANVERYRGSREEAIRLYGVLATRYPTRDTWSAYGTMLMQARRCDEAIPALQHALRLDGHEAATWINIATCDQIGVDFGAAVEAYRRAQAIDSATLVRGNINHEFGVALMHLGLLDSARAVYALMLRRPEPGVKALGHRSLAYVLMLRGQYRAAAAQLDSAIRLDREAGAWLSAFRNDVILAQAMSTAGEPARARRALDDAWQLVPRLALEPAFAMFAGMEFARAGERERARRMLDTMRAHARPASPDDRTLVALLTARLQLERGQARAARAMLQQADDTTRDAHRLALLADTYAALGFPDSALLAARRLARDVQLGHEQQDDWMRAALRVARLSRARGDTLRALCAYREYVGRWVNADTDVPELVAARRELSSLGPQAAVTCRAPGR